MDEPIRRQRVVPAPGASFTAAMIMNSSTETLATIPSGRGGARSKAPVFVLGCGRSGTKLLYHTLLSAGGFALYHAESNAFNLIGLRFGSLARRGNRRDLLDYWLRSKLFYRSGLTREEIEPRILEECRNAGDFLRILMETIARKQGVARWAECTPLHLLYLPLIKRLFPDALIIHIVRDGRDVAVSLDRIGWIKPFSWDRNRRVLAPALFWKWIVGKGRRYGSRMGADYLEVHYEDVVEKPRESLSRIGAFIDHDLDYDRIQQNAQGSMVDPNSSFRGDGQEKESNPVERWKTVLSADEVEKMESLIGDQLQEMGYLPVTPAEKKHRSFAVSLMGFLYPIYFDVKLWLKTYTPLASVASIGRMGVSDSPNNEINS
jgi:hypothetical protein